VRWGGEGKRGIWWEGNGNKVEAMIFGREIDCWKRKVDKVNSVCKLQIFKLNCVVTESFKISNLFVARSLTTS
jgi:hypothetical protein